MAYDDTLFQLGMGLAQGKSGAGTDQREETTTHAGASIDATCLPTNTMFQLGLSMAGPACTPKPIGATALRTAQVVRLVPATPLERAQRTVTRSRKTISATVHER
ncbi:MAG: hypothetical protein WAZ18_01025 [Alphaproteobacteria bacterium]